MKKAFLTSAMFMLMMVLTSFQVDSEIGGNQSVPKESKKLNIESFGNQAMPKESKNLDLTAEALNINDSSFKSYGEIGGNQSLPKESKKLDTV
jgi:hypothetical protein